MQSKPLLSICIPTYNREKYLKECLESIVHQEGFNISDIEIVISDNASQDNTKELVHDYQKKYSNIRYHRNEENIGPLRNFMKLPDYAIGEYVWFLSDDDMMSDIAIQETKNTIHKNNPAFILSDMFGFWNGAPIDFSKVNKNGSVKELIGIHDFFDFLASTSKDITPFLMALSIFCFKRELYMKNLSILLDENGEDYIKALGDDYFVHSRIIFLPFGYTNKMNIIEKDLILCRGNNISWDFKLKACKDLKQLIEDLNEKYKINKKAYSKMKNRYYYSLFGYVMMVHVKKYIPSGIYSSLIYVWRRFIKLISASPKA